MDILVVETNSFTADCILSMNFEIQGAELPAEIELVSAGPVVTGRDGRSWKNPGFAAINAFFQHRGLKIPIDVEHATELKAPKGEEAPAMAWISRLIDKGNGAVAGAVEWNPRGTELVGNREYSYYSPAYLIDKATGAIVGIKSVGLTNNPNLRIPALNSEGTHITGGNTMELEQMLAALGLPAGTTFAAALNHIAKMRTDLTTALNQAENPSLDRFVPKADYDLAVNRATDAEGKLQEQTAATLETAINAEIAAALAAGKITPATKEYHVAQCRQEGGLERFREFVKSAPAVADATDLGIKKPGGDDTVLNAEELKVLELTGISVEDYKKANNLK